MRLSLKTLIAPRARARAFASCLLLLSSCSPFTSTAVPGPDKQFVGTWYGAALGAGSGAVIGFNLTAATGPGAALGAGFGALFGMFSGLGVDLLEEDQLAREEQLRRLKEIAWVQQVLAEHYIRRMSLHPSRDIFPADWFFAEDNVHLHPGGDLLVETLGQMSRQRMPWSRIVIASYCTSRDLDSQYAKYLSKKRAETIAQEFVRLGVEPRRVIVQPIVTHDPVLIDPDDSADRYRQAIELIPLDY